MNTITILAQLKVNKHRITTGRKAIIDILLQAEYPLSVEQLWEALHKNGILINKTTIYREMDFFIKEGMVRTVHLDNTTKYYELITDSHHHHIVCTNCSKFVDVETKGIEEYLEKLEKKLAQKINFTSVRHSLEFFGECANCQKKKK